jgi:formate hydrogenlyase subunit 3/multisubunit Na+/H+ antiporter MnhD subunit
MGRLGATIKRENDQDGRGLMNIPLILLIALPFIGGLLVIFPGRFLRVLRWIFGLLSAAGTGVLLVYIFREFQPRIESGFSIWKMNSAAGFQFSISTVSLVIAAAFTLLYFFVLLYAIGYYRKNEEADTEFHTLSLFMLGSSLGLLFTNDIIFIFLFWEIAAVAAWRLIGFERTSTKIAVAGRTLLINFFGSALMLVGFMLLVINSGTVNGTFDVSSITFNLGGMGGNLPVLAGVLILAGVFAKSAVIPLYIWVPQAYAVSPIPAVALLAGMIENLGLIVFMKVFGGTFTLTAAWQSTLLWIALASSIVAGGAALVVKDYRKILGYSTVSQLAFVLAGFALISQVGQVATGAVLFIIAHGIAKATLLLGYGAVELKMGDRDISNQGRLVARFPLIFTGVIIATLSVIGLPPLLGFFAKIDVIFGILNFKLGGILIGAGFILASVFTLLYMLRLISSVFLKGSAPTKESGVRQPIYLSVIVLLLSLTLLGVSVGMKSLVSYLGGGG